MWYGDAPVGGDNAEAAMCSLEKRGGVYLLTLSGDGEHRFSTALIRDIRSALARVRSDPAPLVTAGQGRFFSNGLDLSWANSTGSPEAARARLHQLVNLFSPLVADFVSLPLPTIAAVTGHAAAAGFALALSHDYVFMRADRGFLYMSELDLGLPLPSYFMALLRSKISDPRALRDVTLGAAKVQAAEAVKKGIVDRALPTAGETLQAAITFGEQLAGKNWNGDVYASMRIQAFPELCRAVGVAPEVDEQVKKVPASRL